MPSGFNYAAFEETAIGRLQAGDGLVGKEGVLTGLIQRLVNAALSGELNGHLRAEREEGKANRVATATRKRCLTRSLGRLQSARRAIGWGASSLRWWASGSGSWALSCFADSPARRGLVYGFCSSGNVQKSVSIAQAK